jgi:hypothetical protein
MPIMGPAWVGDTGAGARGSCATARASGPARRACWRAGASVPTRMLPGERVYREGKTALTSMMAGIEVSAFIVTRQG